MRSEASRLVPADGSSAVAVFTFLSLFNQRLFLTGSPGLLQGMEGWRLKEGSARQKNTLDIHLREHQGEIQRRELLCV